MFSEQKQSTQLLQFTQHTNIMQTQGHTKIRQKIGYLRQYVIGNKDQNIVVNPYLDCLPPLLYGMDENTRNGILCEETRTSLSSRKCCPLLGRTMRTSRT